MRLDDLRGRRIALWGAGLETASLVRWLDREGFDYDLCALVIDEPRDNPHQRELSARVPISAPEQAMDALLGSDVVVRSPMVTPYRSELRELARAGIEVTTATGLWLSEHRGDRVIGITGTKGKTTTTMLVAHALRGIGQMVEVGGNIGRPLTEIDDATSLDWVVAELSSYQITDAPAGPRIAIFNNFFAEHADWHCGTDNYFRDKMRLAALPGVEQIVVNADDPRSSQLRGSAKRHFFNGAQIRDDEQITVGGGEIRLGRETLLTMDELPMPGEHNLSNAAGALTAVAAAGFDPVQAAATLSDFEPPVSRLEVVGEREGTKWVDDCFSSTPESVIAALNAFAGDNLILIIGGRFRGQDYSPIVRVMAERPEIRAIGIEDSGRVFVELASAAGLASKVDYRATLEPAVDLAEQLAQAPCSVVLSPAAALMDRLVPATDRPDLFRRLVAAKTADLPTLA